MTTLAPATAEQRTRNPLRPDRLDDVIGQQRAKKLLRRAIDSCFERLVPLDHMLIVGPSGAGKSTLAHVVANELGVRVFSVEAPVSFDTLLELRDTASKGDILLIEEIHQQGIMERRGRSGATQPEVLYAVMEDRVLLTEHGPDFYPSICVVGTTTDEGRLPDAFINRFPLRPKVDAYTREQLREIVLANARTLDLRVTTGALEVFARACRGVPREINNLVRNARMLTRDGGLLDRPGALEVLDANEIAPDGLTADMQAMLVFLYTRAQRRDGQGQTIYQASVNTIATAIGKSRDSKAISLRVEPYLIERGYVQVGHGGRQLTADGIKRAKELE